MQDGGKVETPTATEDDPEWRSDEEASRLRDEAFKRLFAAGRKPQEKPSSRRPSLGESAPALESGGSGERGAVKPSSLDP
jgi:hypothetical protein